MFATVFALVLTTITIMCVMWVMDHLNAKILASAVCK